ncbi:MAG: SAM-dependent DNA methyltransferase [Chloroflexi bacterium]|nr:SAM-dependent DNA methyltransferase [Chloroflexota bacterium]
MKDPATAAARAAKRESGVFYTPSDVADYVVEHVRQLFAGNFVTAAALDPACGTGVFLLAMLRAAGRQQLDGFSPLDYVTSCLHGLDVSGHALDAAAFLLLKECVTELQSRSLSPLAAWQSIRRNLVEVDALSVDAALHDDNGCPRDMFAARLPLLREVFPDDRDGFDILIGNPPYASLGKRVGYYALTLRFSSLRGVKASPRVSMFPLFVEMMWQFTKPGFSTAALVTPLSIAFHRGLQYERCRHAMSRNGGHWQFAFFDREPHALFGEEVKTRNAILFRWERLGTPKRGEAANIETGPLRKWTSRTRASLFQNIGFTPLGSVDISFGIPKLAATTQADALLALIRRRDRLPSLALRISTCTPTEALIAAGAPQVFVGGTAYNFLNVYRPTALMPNEQGAPLSESVVHRLEFNTEGEASAAFAILSSRLAFWMWHVLGDGFHVGGWLIQTIPFCKDSFSKADFDLLSDVGNVLWHKLQDHRFVSLNRGRQTIGFRPLACDEEREAIDTVLSRAAGLDDRFLAELRRFVKENAVVDSADERRYHVTQRFSENFSL